ncbi:DUF1015 family protein [Mucilaginibacter sp.]|uniref:DUF1015 family protein n=1 Tax=Mucilaginibacter sp. TaxID=1882438 RepID=UPI002609F23E|nr:DUF1015 family protein [Mucilaginibacter sp.]MDB4919277.1 hypothetical protein [Mucilaginibacter sp.]
MANIKPFRAIRPNSAYADQLVFTTMHAESVSGDLSKSESLPPLKTLLETIARQRPETPEGQINAYEEVNNTLKSLLENDRLWHEERTCIYVYEIVTKNYRQAGIWALTKLSDYTNGTIRTHELTFADSVRRLKNYRQHTGLEGSPVLLTYPPHLVINRIIAETRTSRKRTSLGNREGFHRLWKIEDEGIIKKLTEAFSQVGTVYLADGHHRLESADRLAAEQQAAGLVVYDTISSLYIASDQLRMQEYDRIVLPAKPIEREILLDKISKGFFVQKARGNRPVQTREKHMIGMYIDGKWFNLEPKEIPFNGIAAALDVSVLQDQLLAPVFGIADAATDLNLKCIGGEKAMEELQALLEIHPDAIAFTLCPLTVNQLIEVADAGEILPPKSTWIDPKVPYGLLMHRHY